MPREMRGVTWWEIVFVYLPDVATDVRAYLVGKAIEVGVRWAKNRFKKSPARPKYIEVRDHNREELTSVVLKSPRHKPVSKEEATRPQPVPKRRKKPKSGSRSKRKPKGKPKKK